VLISSSILFLTLVALAFVFGMSKITEISLGSLIGQGTLEVILPNSETIQMTADWGLGIGFYLCIFSSLILTATGFIDFLRKRKWPKILKK
jgi:branched-subunit amino acid ABC-type transport system permease component